MRSAPSSTLSPDPHDDRTAKARIRDAAMARFAKDGIAETSVRTVARDAHVSPALVIHHFGSKDGLRAACDAYTAALIRKRKLERAAAGPGMDPLAVLRGTRDYPPVIAYLAKALVEPSPRTDALFDELVADAVDYTQAMVRAGMLQPTDHPRERAAVLTIWALGALVLNEHVKRTLGVDLTGEVSDPADLSAYAAPALEIYGTGVLTAAFADTLRISFLGGVSDAASSATHVDHGEGAS